MFLLDVNNLLPFFANLYTSFTSLMLIGKSSEARLTPALSLSHLEAFSLVRVLVSFTTSEKALV